MGKKPQKTKELSVAIAEASSSTGDETGKQQSQPQTQPQAPRKRGRPRKIAVKTESEEKKLAQPIEQPAADLEAAQGKESSMRKGETSEEEQHEHGGQQEGSSLACMRITKEEGVLSEEIQLPKGEPSRSRARRKSKPRKSS